MTSMNEPQPAPVDTGSPAVWPMVIADVEDGLGDCNADVLPLVLADMRERDATGRAKYGVPLRADNGRDHFIDALQEAYDCAVYMRAELQRTICEGRHPGVIVRIYRSVLQNAFSIRSAIAARGGQSTRRQEIELSEVDRLTVALAVQAQATSATAAKLHSRSLRVDQSGEAARAAFGLGPDDEEVDTLAHIAELKRKAKAFDEIAPFILQCSEWFAAKADVRDFCGARTTERSRSASCPDSSLLAFGSAVVDDKASK